MTIYENNSHINSSVIFVTGRKTPLVIFYFVMGFPHLHNYVLKNRVVYPITEIEKLERIKKVNRLYIDCNGLIYKASYNVSKHDLLNNSTILLGKVIKIIHYYLEIIQTLPNIQYEPVILDLIYDGKSPVQKRVLQNIRDDNIKKRTSSIGLTSIEDRNIRVRLIDEVSHQLQASFESHPTVAKVQSSLSTEPGEADTKIVKLHTDNASSSYSVIVTCDTDIFLSFGSPSMLDSNILVLLVLPITGYHFFTSYHLREWIEENNVNYKNLLYYFLFFCGSDYDVPIISGTINQIATIDKFIFTHKYEISVELIIECWSKLNRRYTKPAITVTGLTNNILREIVEIKLSAAKGTVEYYSSGQPLSDIHSLSTVNLNWKKLIQNIRQEQLSLLL